MVNLQPIFRGDGFSFSLRLTDKNKNPVDLTGASAVSTWRDEPCSEDADFQWTVNSSTGDIVFTQDQVADGFDNDDPFTARVGYAANLIPQVEPGVYFFDLELTLPGAAPITFGLFKVEVQPDSSR